MITLISGVPGTGKTTKAVSMMLELLKEREKGQGAGDPRTIYCHDINGLILPHLELKDPREWPTEVEDHAVILIDEVQKHFGKNAFNARHKQEPPAFLADLATHRHRGIDFILMTQDPSLLHPMLLAQVQRHIHLRNAEVFGRHWYEWPGEVNVRMAWKTAPISGKYTLDKAAQACFVSSVGHYKPKKTIPKQIYWGGFAVVALVAVVWRMYGSISEKVEAPKLASAASAASAAPSASGALPRPTGSLPTEPARAGGLPGESAAPQLAGCVAMGKRCECIDTQAKVMTVELSFCELNTKRGGAAIAYAGGVREFLRAVPDVSTVVDKPHATPDRAQVAQAGQSLTLRPGSFQAP